MNITDEAFYRVSIKAIIKNPEHKILLVQEHDGRWELPGGGLKHGERIEQTLHRELMEELGVEISKISEHPEYLWTQKREKNGIEYFCLFLGFSVEILTDHFILQTDEATSANFLSSDEIKTLSLHPNLTNFIPLLEG